MAQLSWRLAELRSRLKKTAAVARLTFQDKTSLYPKHVLQFERDFAAYTKADHAVTFANGTTAIEAALFALGLEPGDEIIAPSYTIHSTFSAALCLGIGVRFADIDPETMTMDPDTVEALITDRTKAVMPVHIWGVSADLDRLQAMCAAHDLKLVEDCSHCHGATWNGQRLGTFGDIGVFSLQGAKSVAAGEGGIAITDDPVLLDRMLAYGHQGRRISGTLDKPIETELLPLTGFGRKARAHPLGIAMAAVDLKTLDQRNGLAEEQWRYIQTSLRGHAALALQKAPDAARMGGYYMGAAVRVTDDSVSCDALYRQLQKARIKVSRRNHSPYHKLPHLYDLAYRQAHIHGRNANPTEAPSLPHTERALDNTLLVQLRQFASDKKRKRWEQVLADAARPGQG